MKWIEFLKKGGYIFVRALCKDGDENAKRLLKDSPGEEYDTYIIKEMGLYRTGIFTKILLKLIANISKILKLEKKPDILLSIIVFINAIIGLLI